MTTAQFVEKKKTSLILKCHFSFYCQDVTVHYSWNDLCGLSDRVGHNEVIGVCRVGNDADTLGRNHWSEMLTYPRKPVAHWHPLVEVSWHGCGGPDLFPRSHAWTDFEPFLVGGGCNLAATLSEAVRWLFQFQSAMDRNTTVEPHKVLPLPPIVSPFSHPLCVRWAACGVGEFREWHIQSARTLERIKSIK